MIRRGFLKSVVAAVLFTASGAFAQDSSGFHPSEILVLEIAGQANGVVEIGLRPDVAPLHVAQIMTITRSGAYDGVVFHRVINGFMAQTGDVQNGRIESYKSALAGTGGSDLPNIPAEFSSLSFETGIVGMARSSRPDSANSQFFIMLAPGTFLDGNYTVFGRVIEGMDIVSQIKLGDDAANGAIAADPDYIVRAYIKGDEE